jgi:hypothetical protein
MIMKSSTARTTLGVSLLALCGMAFAASNSAAPVYNPSTEVRMSAVITGVRQIPDGPMAGVHLTVQAKTGTADVYLGPAEFLKIFKTNFPSGAPIQIIGSRVATASGEVILAREVTEGATSITLREFTGAPVWEHWGVVADTAVSGG